MLAGSVAITTSYLIKRPKCGGKNFFIPLRKCNANLSNAQDHVEMGGAALHSLWPALSFRYPMTTNQNLELRNLRNLSRLLYVCILPLLMHNVYTNKQQHLSFTDKGTSEMKL